MKIKILMENTAAYEGICAAHGLSIYIETEHHRVLMDTGPDTQFTRNAEKMGVDLAAVDIAILSHGHFDHAGGLVEFMNINKQAKIYAARGYDASHYNFEGKYIGVEPLLVGNPRISVLQEDLIIDDEISILHFAGRSFTEEINSNGMTEGVKDEQSLNIKFLPERFLHEHYLMVNENGHKVLFSGCSHKGIVNIAHWAADAGACCIVGGFHLKDVTPDRYDTLDHVALELLKLPLIYYTGHCTGAEQFEYLKGIMKDRLMYAASGSEFEV